MNNELKINVFLPKNRSKTGYATIYKNNVFHKKINILGRGSRGPGNTQYLVNGNTPAGSFEGEYEPTGGRSVSVYGPNGVVKLEPSGGNATVANRVFGRDQLRIHGGNLATEQNFRGAGALKPTNGCLRVHNSDMLYLKLLMDGKPKISIKVLETR